jgi:hypothetical protein
MSNDVRVATAYLQIEGRAPGRGYDYGTQAVVRGVSTAKPEQAKPGCIVVKVKLRIPKEAWEPFAPEATIDVPADLIQRPIAVEAVDASD